MEIKTTYNVTVKYGDKKIEDLLLVYLLEKVREEIKKNVRKRLKLCFRYDTIILERIFIAALLRKEKKC